MPDEIDLQDILSAAVDRQIAEQRALQETLDGVAGLLRELRTRDPADGLATALERLEADLAERSTTELAGLRSELTSTVDRVASELAGMRSEMERFRSQLADTGKEPQASAELGTIRSEVAEIAGIVASIARTVEGSDGGGKELSERIAAVEERLESLPEAVTRGVKDSVAPTGSDPELRALVQSVPDRVQELFDDSPLNEVADSLREEMKGLKEELTEAATRDLPAGQLERMRTTVDTAGADVQALAQAMIDLNAGLRDWADAMEERIGSLADRLVAALGDLSGAQDKALDKVTGKVSSSSERLAGRLEGVEQRLVEAAEISKYLQDQADDLDRVLAGLGDVPQRLEGVVAQALRRALTVRAGLAREAEKALERAVEPVEGHLKDLAAELRDAAQETRGDVDERLDVLAGAHGELLSRIEAMETALQKTVDELGSTSRKREEVLAKAIDRAAKGLAPKAAERLASVKPKAAAKKKSAPKSSATGKSTKAGGRRKAAKSSADRGRKSSKGSKGSGSRRGAGRSGESAASSRRSDPSPKDRNFIPV